MCKWFVATSRNGCREFDRNNVCCFFFLFTLLSLNEFRSRYFDWNWCLHANYSAQIKGKTTMQNSNCLTRTRKKNTERKKRIIAKMTAQIQIIVISKGTPRNLKHTVIWTLKAIRKQENTRTIQNRKHNTIRHHHHHNRHHRQPHLACKTPRNYVIYIVDCDTGEELVCARMCACVAKPTVCTALTSRLMPF